MDVVAAQDLDVPEMNAGLARVKRRIHTACLTSNRDIWLDRIVAVHRGDISITTEYETMQIKDAGTILAGLHILEAVAEKAVECHAAGRAMTFGDLATTLALGVEDAVTHSGIAESHWRPAPVKRGGRRPRAAAAGADNDEAAPAE